MFVVNGVAYADRHRPKGFWGLLKKNPADEKSAAADPPLQKDGGRQDVVCSKAENK